MSLVSTIANIINNVMENAPEVGENIQEYVTNQIFGGEPEQQQAEYTLPDLSSVTSYEPTVEQSDIRELEIPSVVNRLKSIQSTAETDEANKPIDQPVNIPFGLSADNDGGYFKDFNDRLKESAQDFSKTEAENTQLSPQVSAPSSTNFLDRFADAQQDFGNRSQKREEYGMPDNISITDGDDLDKYRSIYDSEGGVDTGYVSGATDILNNIGGLVLNSPTYDRGEISDSDAMDNILSGLDKVANETIDDGTLRNENIRSKYMTGSQYKKYVENGLGGRAADDIDNNAVYNKVNEARNYGFKPYVEDLGQYSLWSASQLGDDTTKAFNVFRDIRKNATQPTVNYNGQNINVEDLHTMANDYIDNDNVEKGIKWIFPNDNGGVDEVVSSPNEINEFTNNYSNYVTRSNDGGIDLVLPESGYYHHFLNNEEFSNWMNGKPYEDSLIGNNLVYRQPDGTQVNLSPEEVLTLESSIANGTANIDYGPLNIAKDNDYRKDFGQMLSTMDFSDLLPNTVDLLTGSAPLFFKTTAWPMSIGNAVTASQGLDPQLYDAWNDTYGKLSDDMTGEKYLSNMILSGLVPATEHVAGVIGGSGGVLGKPIQKFLSDRGAPPLLRYGLDMAGEGAEEDVAQLWEDYQRFGHKGWFADPLYETDEDGNIVTYYDVATGETKPLEKQDAWGHQVRDENTPWQNRIMNALEQMPENFIAGAYLGGGLGVPKVIGDRITENGYYSPEERLKRRQPGYNIMQLGPEHIGTYGQQG